MDKTAELMFALLKEKNIEQKEFAAMIGTTDKTVSAWRNGRSMSYTKKLDKIAAALGVTAAYLVSGSSAPTAVTIPVLGDVAAGIPIEAITDIVDYEEIDTAFVGSGEYFGLRLKGASMEPRMRDGDVVIVRKQDDVESGEVAVVMVNGDSATVKRIKKGPSGITLIPNNPVFDPMFYTNDEIQSLPVRILGKVVELRAKF